MRKRVAGSWMAEDSRCAYLASLGTYIDLSVLY